MSSGCQSSAHVLDAGAGSIVLTGSAVAILRAARALGAAGVYSLEGAPADARAARVVGASSGSYLLAGVDARLARRALPKFLEPTGAAIAQGGPSGVVLAESQLVGAKLEG